MPLLSIIIPVYNVENYLEKCLDSILNQGFYDYEIILVNNGSTDNSGEICNQYALKNAKVKVINLDKNCMPAGARNIGLKTALGRYVHFCDSDDEYMVNSVQEIFLYLEETDVDIIIGRFLVKPEEGAFYMEDINYDSEIFSIGNIDDLIKKILDIPKSICTVWRFLIKREFLLNNNLFFLEGYNAEDEDWVIRILCKAQDFSIFNRTFYCYKPRYIGSVTSIKTYQNSSKSYLGVVLNLLNTLPEYNYGNNIREKFILSKINELLGLFNTRCDTLSEENIEDLASMIEQNIKYIQLLKKVNKSNDFFYFIDLYGPKKGLDLFKKYIVETTLKKLQGSENKDIYIFPTGYNGEATARILKNNKYKVKCFLDNSETKEGSIVEGLEVNMPSILKDLDEDNFKNSLVVISTQKKKIIDILISQLREFNIKDEQIIIRIY